MLFGEARLERKGAFAERGSKRNVQRHTNRFYKRQGSLVYKFANWHYKQVRPSLGGSIALSGQEACVLQFVHCDPEDNPQPARPTWRYGDVSAVISPRDLEVKVKEDASSKCIVSKLWS